MSSAGAAGGTASTGVCARRRTCSVVESQEPLANAAKPVGAHHNQVNGFAERGLQDDVGRVPDSNLE